MQSRTKTGKAYLTGADRRTIRRLLSFLPFFERPGLEIGGARAEWENGVLHIYPAEYLDEVYAFFSLLVPPFIDLDYPSKPVKQWLANPAFLEHASPEQLRTVMTWVCRSERFCDGCWTDQFRNGNLVKALHRLQSLQDLAFHFDAAASARVEKEANASIMPADEVITVEFMSTAEDGEK